MRSYEEDEPRVLPLLPHVNDRRRQSTFSSFNMDSSYVRMPIICLVLFIWIIPTLIIAINRLFNSQVNNLTLNDEINLKIYICGHVFILMGIICSFLVQWYHVTNHVFCVKSIVAFIYLIGGILQCIATALTTNNICKHTKDTIFNINYDTSYCHLGYISTQLFGDVIPIFIAFDYIFNIFTNARMRLLLFNLLLFTSTLLWIIVYIHYIQETKHKKIKASSQSIDINFFADNQEGIYNVGKIGWLCVCAISGLISLLMLFPFYKMVIWSNKIKTSLLSTFAILLLTGMSLSLVGINILIFEFKYQTAIYAAMISIITFDLLTF